MAQIDLGSLFIKIGANTEALDRLPNALKGLESSIGRLEASVSSLNMTMNRSYQGVANSAMKSAESIKKSSEAKVKAEEAALRKMTLLHMKALEMNAKFDEQRAKTSGKYSLLGFSGGSSRLSEETSKQRNLGLAAQNTSYQLQDMIVQLEMGTDVARVMGQQLPQLFSGFGPLGAILGVVAAGLAVAIPYMLSSGESAEEAAKKIDKYKEAMNLAVSTVDDLKESQAKLNGTMADFKLNVFQQELDRLSKIQFSTDFFDVIRRGFTETKSIEVVKALHKAQKDLAETQRNNIKTDIVQTSTILNQTAAYHKGLITLREYGIQKKLIEEIDSQGIQGNAEAIRLAEERIRLQTQLGDEESFVKIARDVADLNIGLSQSNQILSITTKLGINAGEQLKHSFSQADAVRDYYRALKDAGEVQARYYAAQLNISTAGLSNEEIFNKVARAMANAKNKTTDLATATSNLVEIQKTTADLSDRIAGFKAGGGAFGQIFSPELFKQASDFEERTREIQRNLEFKTAGDTSIVKNSINEYSKVAKEAGMVNPFEGIDPKNTRAVAEGIASIEQSIADLDQNAVKTISTFSNLARNIQRAWMEIDTLGQHGEFAAKKLKDSFEVQDIFENVSNSVTSWEQLALAVESAAKEGVDISNVYTYATNSSTALKDAIYGLALALAQVKIKTQEAGDAQARIWDSSAIVEMNNKLNDANLQLGVMDRMTLGDKFINMFDTAPLEKMIQKERDVQARTIAFQQLLANSPTDYAFTVDNISMALERLNITGQDLSSPQGLAGAMVEIDKKMKELPFSAKAVLDAVANIAGQAASLFGQLSSMYAEQASYHKQMADQALSYGRDQANLYMELADAVHYSNNAQAQSFEQKAIAAAEAAAKQYEAEKKAQAQSNALAKKNFENQKKLQIAQAIAATATAVIQTYSSSGLGLFAAPLAVTMGALGAAQVAIIQKQEYIPRETGGTIYGNKAYITSEGGPELFVPGRSGTMLSQKEIMEGLTNGRSSDANVNFTIQAIDTQSAAQVIAANRGMIENIVRRATNKEMRK